MGEATAQSSTIAVDPDDVRVLIARLRAQPSFVGSPQLLRFLDYVVEETLAGRGDTLKAYTIATVALGRPADFDPAGDPIVRVEATRLRQKLDAYYANEGAGDPVRIRLATGSYQALFKPNGNRQASAGLAMPVVSALTAAGAARPAEPQPAPAVVALPAYVPWAMGLMILLMLADLLVEAGPMLFGNR